MVWGRVAHPETGPQVTVQEGSFLSRSPARPCSPPGGRSD